MTVKTSTCFTVTCDVCDEHPESEWGGEAHFDTEAAALNDAAEGEWWATSADVLCTDRDDDHLAKAKEIRAALDDFDVSEFDAWLPAHWREQLQPAEPRFAAAMPGQTETEA